MTGAGSRWGLLTEGAEVEEVVRGRFIWTLWATEKIGHLIWRTVENYCRVLTTSLPPVLRIGCRRVRVGAGTPATEFIVIRLEMTMARTGVKPGRSSQIVEILWRESRGPGGRVNRHSNRQQTNPQDVPHQPFSQTSIMLDDNSAFTQGKPFAGVASVSWWFFWMAVDVLTLLETFSCFIHRYMLLSVCQESYLCTCCLP